MTTSLTNKANKFLILGFALSIVPILITYLVNTPNSLIDPAKTLISLAGTLIFIYGCMLYCQAKGQNQWLGLLGLLNLIGLIILVLLPDKNKTG